MLGSALTRALRVFLAGAVVAAAAAKTPPDGDVDEIPRTADDRPDLSGTYDIAMLTPLDRGGRQAPVVEQVGVDLGGGRFSALPQTIEDREL